MKAKDTRNFRLRDLFVARRPPSLLLFCVMLGCVYWASVSLRVSQLETWAESRDSYFVDGEPLITSTDAGYYLMAARGYHEYGVGVDPYSEYPYASPDAVVDTNDTGTTPLLSVLIAEVSQITGWKYSLAANQLLPVLASLFIIPLGFFFFRLGMPLVGLVAGFVGAFSFGYLGRTSIGRIDTDMLNTFFPFLLALWALCAVKAKSDRGRLLYAALMGATMYLFMWWYNKPGFVVLYAGALAAMLLFRAVRPKAVAMCVGLFLLLSGPTQVLKSVDSITGFLRAYTGFDSAAADGGDAAVADAGRASFGHYNATIQEARKVDLDDVFLRLFDAEDLVWLGLIGFGVFALFWWRDAIALAPLAALGGMAFVSGSRFVMYLAPVVGIGLGLVLTAAMRAAGIGLADVVKGWLNPPQTPVAPAPVARTNGKKLTKKERARLQAQQQQEAKAREAATPAPPRLRLPDWGLPLAGELAAYAVAAYLVFDFSAAFRMDYLPHPKYSAATHKAWEEVGKRTEPDAVLLTWWDFGYSIMDITKRSVIHHGGAKGPQTYFVARGLSSNDPGELSRIARFLVGEGLLGIDTANTSAEALEETIETYAAPSPRPVYVLFTEDMVFKFGAISSIGSRDLRTGDRWVEKFNRLWGCRIKDRVMNCNQGYSIDLEQGVVSMSNGQTQQLRRIVVDMVDGEGSETNYAESGRTVQIRRNAHRVLSVIVMQEKAYSSNFNQLYHLGRHGDLFTEVYNFNGRMRLFRVNAPEPTADIATTADAPTAVAAAPANPPTVRATARETETLDEGSCEVLPDSSCAEALD